MTPPPDPALQQLAPKLTQPLHDLSAWTTHLRGAGIPVLARSAAALEALRAHEDDVDANTIGETFANDPLMSLKVLAHVATLRGERVVTDAETVIAALVMLGISPFFAAFGAQVSVEERLADDPAALAGLDATLQRAHRAASYALAFAVHRMDRDAALIHAATLLHDFAEMLLWCHAPALALRIRERQRADPSLRSGAAQAAVLNIELADLQQSLMKAWHLPQLLIRVNDDRHADSPNVRTVHLATRLARHTARGWDDAAIPDDIDEIATLLNLSIGATLQLVREI